MFRAPPPENSAASVGRERSGVGGKKAMFPEDLCPCVIIAGELNGCQNSGMFSLKLNGHPWLHD